ncbi:MAG: hypothetical protein GXX78_04890, partial [Bacteroidales bacterium]|nr:hypothetical protein [Bacteroidales bacterium]
MKNETKINQSICRILIFMVIIVASFTTNKPVLAAIPEPSEITVIDPPKASDATQITTTSFQANWSSVKGASSYKLTVAKWGGRDIRTGDDIWNPLFSYRDISVSGTSLVVTGLSAGTRYAYIVKSVSLTEILPSDPSNIIEVTTTPEPPVATFITNLTDNSFVANWDASTGAISYKLYVQYRQYIPITQTYIWRSITGYETGLAVSGTSYTVSNLSHSTNYRYSVKAIGSSAESDYSNSITVQTLPGSTVATAATEITATSFTANWESQTWADSYVVRLVRESDQAVIGDQEVETTSYTFTSLSPGYSYRYLVKVKSGDLSSPYSNFISVATIPPAPVAITETDLEHNSFKAHWNAADGATSYLLRVVEDETQGYILEDYETTDLFATVSGLQTNSLYHYAVKAKNSSGVSAISNWIHLTTKPAPPVLNQPTNITTSSISLSWSAVSGATGYKLYYRSSGGIILIRYSSQTLGNVTEYTFTGLDIDPGTPYDFYVTALNANGESLASNKLTDVYTALGAPIANEATNIASELFQANWSAVSGATGYKLSVYKPGMIRGSWVVLSEYNDKDVSGTNFKVTGLTPNSGYRYGVKSVIGTTPSVMSNYIFVTTTEATPEQNTVSLSASPSNMGSVSGGGTFDKGSSVTVTATPSSALYRFVNWTEGALIVSTNASYTFTINSNRTLVANFELV